MALGFQDCCNQYSFFNVVGIPSTVSEYEVYYIRTVEGVNFCATYREIPVLNYTPPSYILLEMTQQTDCAVCIESNPCPAEETIFINQFLAGSVVVGTDCSVQTRTQMVVECRSTNPSLDNQADGVVALFVTGGTPPYTFFSADTQEVINTFMNADVYTVFPNATEGSYNIVVVDDAGDFIIPITCVLDAPPNLPIIVPIMTPATFFGKPDGKIDFDITGGNPPYTIIFEGEIITPPLLNLAAGTYIFQILDQETYQEVSVEVTQPPQLNFPTALCLQLTLCGSAFKITFVKTDELRDYRPIYRSSNASQLGIVSMNLQWDANLNFTGWYIPVVNIQVEDIRWQQEPGVCNNLNNPTFGALKQAQTLNELPQGTYIGVGISLLQTVTVTPGGCPPSLTAEVLEGYCAGPPVSLGKVQLEAFGGAGPPFTFLYSAGNGGAYTQTTSSTLELVNGTYAVKVRDALGVESTPISFTIPTESNLFYGSQIGFCSTIENLQNIITGTLTPLNEGESTTFEVVISEYFDFSTLPAGTELSGRFKTTVSFVYTGADDGYNQVNDAIETLFVIQEAYILQDGVRTNWNTSDFVVQSLNAIGGVPDPNPEGPLDQLGSVTPFTTNYGWFLASASFDQCPDFDGTVTRVSPNYWYDCDTLYGDAIGRPGPSLIEDDPRGKYFNNISSYTAPLTNYNSNTRLYMRYQIRMKNKMPVYIPTILNETNATSAQPTFYTPTGQQKLNIQNTENSPVGGLSTYQVNHSMQNVAILQRPASPPCWGVPTNSGTWNGLGWKPSQFGPEGTIRSQFQLDSPYIDQSLDVLPSFRASNNTCVGIPSWAQ